MWSLENYCATQHPPIDLSVLPSTTASFIKALDLPSTHPFCDESFGSQPFPAEGVAPMGALDYRFEGESALETAVTLWSMISPALLAMGELWLRLFAGALGPMGIVYLLVDEWNHPRQEKQEKQQNGDKRSISLVCILCMASALVLMTDTQYVLDNGPWYGVILFFAALLLCTRACMRHKLWKVTPVMICIVVLAMHLVWDYDHGTISFGNKADEVRIDEGLYYDKSNPFVSSLVENWQEKYRVYNKANGATSWMPTGDSRTGFPFLLNHWKPVEWTRVFLETYDGEYVSLHMSFPPEGHDYTKPVYMVLHGLSGGSTEEFVQDLTHRRTAEGSTVVVMVARGLMDLPVRGYVANLHRCKTTTCSRQAQQSFSLFFFSSCLSLLCSWSP